MRKIHAGRCRTAAFKIPLRSPGSDVVWGPGSQDVFPVGAMAMAGHGSLLSGFFRDASETGGGALLGMRSVRPPLGRCLVSAGRPCLLAVLVCMPRRSGYRLPEERWGSPPSRGAQELQAAHMYPGQAKEQTVAAAAARLVAAQANAQAREPGAGPPGPSARARGRRGGRAARRDCMVGNLDAAVAAVNKQVAEAALEALERGPPLVEELVRHLGTVWRPCGLAASGGRGAVGCHWRALAFPKLPMVRCAGWRSLPAMCPCAVAPRAAPPPWAATPSRPWATKLASRVRTCADRLGA